MAKPKGRYVYRDVDPRSVTPHHNNLNRKAVDYYKKNPNGKWDSSSGEPEVDKNGKLQNGVHRRRAAIESGRKLRVKEWKEDEPKMSKTKRGILGGSGGT